MLISKLISFRDGVFVGGAANPLVNMSRALVEAGHTVNIVAGTSKPEQEASVRKILDWADVYLVPIRNTSPGVRGFQTFLALFLRASQVCRRNRCDVIHGHSGYAQWAGLTAMVGRATGNPSIHTLYCPITDRMDDRRNLLMNLQVARMCLSLPDHIVAISNNVKRSIVASGIAPSHVAVIPPSIDNRRFGPQVDGEPLRQQLGLGANSQIVLFVGNLTQTKGIDILLKAMQHLIANHPSLRLVYTIERGPAITNVRDKAIRELIDKIGIGNQIIELGIVKDMPALMAACDVFVVPYRSTDGPSDYPIAMLEAMAIGRPVVATRVGAIPEIIVDNETGVLVEPGDPVGLVSGVASLLDNPSRAKAIGEAGLRIVHNKFAPNCIAQAMEKIFLDVLEKKY